MPQTKLYKTIDGWTLRQPRITHIDTLAERTPKARRRVRLAIGFGATYLPNNADVKDAQVVTSDNENRDGQRFLTGSEEYRLAYRRGERGGRLPT